MTTVELLRSLATERRDRAAEHEKRGRWTVQYEAEADRLENMADALDRIARTKIGRTRSPTTVNLGSVMTVSALARLVAMLKEDVG